MSHRSSPFGQPAGFRGIAPIISQISAGTIGCNAARFGQGMYEFHWRARARDHTHLHDRPPQSGRPLRSIWIDFHRDVLREKKNLTCAITRTAAAAVSGGLDPAAVFAEIVCQNTSATARSRMPSAFGLRRRTAMPFPAKRLGPHAALIQWASRPEIVLHKTGCGAPFAAGGARGAGTAPRPSSIAAS